MPEPDRQQYRRFVADRVTDSGKQSHVEPYRIAVRLT
jgi:hypothetical protein